MKKKGIWLAVVIFLASIFLIGHGGINESFVAHKKYAASEKVARGQEQKKIFDARYNGVCYHFNDTDTDLNYGTLVLGSTVNHVVEIGEAF
jgi:hypothetical protein